MQARVARLYEVGERETGCPGEDKCETWQSSADDQPAEFRCPSCPKRNGQGKPAKNEEPSAEEPERFHEKQLLDRVERFARERDSGRRVYELLLPLEWELLIIRDETIEKYERGMQINMAVALEILCASASRGH